MIGGVDVIFRTHLKPAEALDLCARAIMHRWPKALFQDATTGELYAKYASVPFERSPEFMVYRDQEAFASWEELEAHPSNQNTMIHILAYKPGQATVVVDDAAALEVRNLLNTIRYRLQDASIRVGTQEADVDKEAA